MTNGTILLSTHDLEVAGPLREAFREAGYRVELVTPGEELGGMERPLLLILTGELASEGARGLVREARGVLGIPVFGVSREEEKELRETVREMGLHEVFSHPVDFREILLVGRTLVERLRLQEITGIVGKTDAVREALERVVQIAPVNATVLVTGESGTGKELVARGIRALSPRRHKPFIAVNVAALSESLLESELFGHEKGAFTGAIDARRGLFELAQGGTIFLDEIGEMPPSTQTKLLRVLEEREFYRVGGEHPLRVDVRVIAATNQPLRQLVEVGEFRRDLYFRLNVLHIELPPLRERKADIPLLVKEFVREACARHDRSFVGISGEAMEILQDCHWPGNVRELRNLVESMVVLAPGRRIEARDIPAEVRNPMSRGLLPARVSSAPLPARREGETALRPELEFVFRTLVSLRMDLDDLRRDFEAYKEGHDLEGREVELLREVVSGGAPLPTEEAVPDPASSRGEGDAVAPRPEEREGAVVYRPGMTMEEVEAAAIRKALQEVGGNRRRAAGRLGIGERTLYRKIRKYGLED